jgi:hypothetical protein
MSIRTDIATVKLYIATDATDPQITEYIALGSSDIDNAAALSAAFAALGATQLKQLETLLACHYLACLRDRRAQEVELGKSKVKWQGSAAMAYDATHFGQMAIKRDPTGTLAAIASGSISQLPTTVLGPG